MNVNEFNDGIKSGKYPANDKDLGPFTSKVHEMLDQLKGGVLLSFSGTLDEKRFSRVTSIDEAERLAYEPTESEFAWEEDRCAVWAEHRPENLFSSPEAMNAYKSNFDELGSSINELLDSELPEDYRYVCFDSVYADLLEIFKTIAFFGELDELNTAIWEAYRQGGWPCGLTGGPLTGNRELKMDGRRVIVLWSKE